MPTLNIRTLGGAALLACATAIAATEPEVSMPSAHEYFRWAATLRLCNGDRPVDTPGLLALRAQALAYYRTKAAHSAEPDRSTAQAIDELEANIVPGSEMADARHVVPSWTSACKLADAAIDQALARNDLAMATTGWPGAKPLDQARDEAAAVGVHDIHKPLPPREVRLSLPAPRTIVPPRVPTARVHVEDPACRPGYPAAAARALAMGVTYLRFTVDPTGKVVAAETTRTSGPTREHRLLDNAAKASLATCPIEPAVDANGVPVASTVELTYTWKLD